MRPPPRRKPPSVHRAPLPRPKPEAAESKPDARPPARPPRRRPARRVASDTTSTAAPQPEQPSSTADQSAWQQQPASPAPARRKRTQQAPDEGYVAVGRVLGPFGLKGELRVQSLTDNPRRFAKGSRLRAGNEDVTVARSREAQGFVYVTFAGHDDRTSAAQFRFAMLQVPEDDLPPLAEGEYYRFQLLGMEVVDAEGAPLGVLEEVIETGANDVYRVRDADGKDILLPALDDVIISVDLASKRIVADPPDWR